MTALGDGRQSGDSGSPSILDASPKAALRIDLNASRRAAIPSRRHR